MKKKFMLAAIAIFAAAAISLSSCGGSPADKAINLCKEATEQVKNAKSYDELREIKNDFKAKAEQLEASCPDFKPTKEERKAIGEAMEAFDDAYREAKRELR